MHFRADLQRLKSRKAVTPAFFIANTLRMENTAPHLSIAVYLSHNASLLETFQKDVESFFSKFPIAYEVIIVAEPDGKNINAPSQWSYIQNEKHLGRAKSVALALSQARGSCFTSMNLEMTTPLGDIFKLLQNLLADDSLDFCWGNRYSKKDGPFLNHPSERHHLEKFFNGILKEKNKSYVADPLSETFVFKKSSWHQAQENFQNISKTWYLGPTLMKACREKSLKVQELPVYDSGKTSAAFSFFKERLRLYMISIF